MYDDPKNIVPRLEGSDRAICALGERKMPDAANLLQDATCFWAAKPQAFLENKRVMLTGGASGLGAALVERLCAAGAFVAFCDLDREAGEALTLRLQQQFGARLFFKALDVSDKNAAADFAGRAADWLGGLDMALNNAGISHRAAPFAALDLQEAERVFAVNLMGVWYAMYHQIPLLKANAGGAIVNIASILSSEAAPFMAAYGVSKQAVLALTKTAALDHAGDHIRVNAFSPGPIDTPMFARALRDIGGDLRKFAGGLPAGGPMKAAALAPYILYLLSDEARGITGFNWHFPSLEQAIDTACA